MRNSNLNKPKKENIRKWETIFLLVFLVCSCLIIIASPNLKTSTAKDVSTSTEISINDFLNGTLDNLTLIGIDSKADLVLESIDLNKWTNNTQSIGPGIRQEPALATIWGTDKVLLFGGFEGELTYDDTWVYDLSDNNWTNMKPIIHPPLRYFHAMASIHRTDKVVLMGGIINLTSTIVYNDTWVYDLSDNIWIHMPTSNNPGNIHQHRLASIYSNDKVVLFGGAKGSVINETWVYDLSENSWTKKSPVNSPSVRSVHSMASIYGTDKVMIFAGFLNNNDTWVYDLSDNNWTQMAFGPNTRSQHAMTSIYGTDKVLLFGGVSETAIDFNDTWLYDFSDNIWTKLRPSLSPYPMLGHAMATVWGTDKIVLFTGGGLYWFNDTWIFELNDYVLNGSFTSPPFKYGPYSSLKKIIWVANNTINTSIKFQLRSAKTEIELFSKDFIGPFGYSLNFYNNSDNDIWVGHYGDSWVQYKAYLSTINDEETPVLKNVTIIYNYWPNTTLVSPKKGYFTNNNNPRFIWNFTDCDSIEQSAFQIVISDDINFSSIDFKGKIINSSENYTFFSDAMDLNKIPDGTWYWKVRTKDNDGDWGFYSKPWKITIDTITPSSMVKYPGNNIYYNKMDRILGLANDSINGTGLHEVEISIHRMDDNTYFNGLSWISTETWLPAAGTEKWTYDSSAITWYSGWKYSIKSRAIDNAANIEIPNLGTKFIYDPDTVKFSNAFPSSSETFNTTKIEVGITITDDLSGVNASFIEYSISNDNGITWTPFEQVFGYENANSIDIQLNLTLSNGSGNRIRWRAYDIAGNGPTYSDEYVINVNIPKPPSIPEVELISPVNNSKLPITSIELTWEVIKNYHPNIVFDIKLGTQNPPHDIIEKDYTDTKLIVDELENGKTYYWTVIPRLNNINGTCLSGVWSFAVDIPLPKVTLLIPANGSVITSTRPTITWALEYAGSSTIKYDIYFGTDKNPGIYKNNITTKYFSIDFTLEDNTTYYWYIEPFAGGLRGYRSPVWSFTVKLKQDDKIPMFGIELDIDSNPLEIKPGEVKFVSAIVTNLGELNDNFTVSIKDVNNSKLTVEVYRQDTLEIASGKNKEFLIMVSLKEGIEPGYGNITILARSKLAEEYGLDVRDSKEITVKILPKTKQKDGNQSTGSLYFSIMIYVLFLMIIFVVILILVLKNKTGKKDEGQNGQKILSQAPVAYITTPEPEHTVEQEPVPLQQEESQAMQQDEQKE